MGRRLEFAKLVFDRSGPVSEFSGGHPAEQRHDNRLLHQHQESRHHHRDPLHSLSADRGSPARFSITKTATPTATSPDIPAALQACASPNFFYTANTPADINSALLSMFQQAVNTAHITN